MRAAEQCYLWEALLWVAVGRFPLEAPLGEAGDLRDYPRYVGGIEPEMPDRPVTVEECRRVGLPPNPADEVYSTADRSVADRVREIETLSRSELPEFSAKKAAEAEALDVRQQEWDAEFDAYADVHRTKLFLALREGKLTAIGKKLPVEFLEKDRWDDAGLSDGPRWEQIPPKFWISDKINWRLCWAKGREKDAYAQIRLNTDDLMSCFPPPDAERVDGIARLGDVLLFPSGLAPVVLERGKRGRPAYPWKMFDVEVARRILREGGLPKKQESLVAEMLEWCRASWGPQVGRSTVLEQLQPYYSALASEHGGR